MNDFFSEFLFENQLENIETLCGVGVHRALEVFPKGEKEPRPLVDGKRRIISPDVSHQGIDNGCQVLGNHRYAEDIGCIRVETVLAFVGDHYRRCLVGFENGRVLDDISSTVAREPAAQTMIRGSEERSMCFLSSMKSEESVL